MEQINKAKSVKEGSVILYKMTKESLVEKLTFK